MPSNGIGGNTSAQRIPLGPPPKIAELDHNRRFGHMLRVHEVVGANAAWRSAVIPGGQATVDDGPPAARRREGPGAAAAPEALGAQSERSSWAALLRRRVFALAIFIAPAAAADAGLWAHRRRGCGSCSSGSGSGRRRPRPSRRARRRAWEHSRPSTLVPALPRSDCAGPFAVSCLPASCGLWPPPASSPRGQGSRGLAALLKPRRGSSLIGTSTRSPRRDPAAPYLQTHDLRAAPSRRGTARRPISPPPPSPPARETGAPASASSARLSASRAATRE